MKTCSLCEAEKPESSFWRNTGFTDGRESTCADCKNTQRRQRYLLDDNYRKNITARNIRKAKQSTDKTKARRARYTATESCRASKKKWKMANPDIVRDHDHLRRARKHNAVMERVSRKRVWIRDNGQCYLCGIDVPFEKMHLEHKVPLCKGGKHSYANTAVSCAPCNLRKGVNIA